MKIIEEIYRYYKKIDDNNLKIGIYESPLSADELYQIKIVFKKEKICISIIQFTDASAIFFCAVSVTSKDPDHGGRYRWQEIRIAPNKTSKDVPVIAYLIKLYVDNIDKFRNNKTACGVKELVQIIKG